MKTILICFFMIISFSANSQLDSTKARRIVIIANWVNTTANISLLVGTTMPDSVHKRTDSVDLYFGTILGNIKISASKDDYIYHLERVIAAKEKEKYNNGNTWGSNNYDPYYNNYYRSQGDANFQGYPGQGSYYRPDGEARKTYKKKKK